MEAARWVGAHAGERDVCWTFVREFLTEELDVALPAYERHVPKMGGAPFVEALAPEAPGNWERTEEPYGLGDLLFFRIGSSLHAGVMIDAETMLHAWNGAGVCPTKIHERLWARTLLGAFRRTP